MAKTPHANAGDMRLGFDPWVRKVPWRKAWQPTPVFLPGNSRDRGAWQVAAHSVSKSWTQLNRLSMRAHPFRCLPLEARRKQHMQMCDVVTERGWSRPPSAFPAVSQIPLPLPTPPPSVSGQLVTPPAACVSVSLITSIMVSATRLAVISEGNGLRAPTQGLADLSLS